MQKKPIIWILEDDDGAIFVYKESLGFRYELRFFEKIKDLRTALDAQKNLPQLMVLDLYLPDGCTLDHITGLKAICPLNLPPFLVVSSLDDLDALRKCFALGALDYLTKPFKKNELITKLERFLEHKKQMGPAELKEKLTKMEYKIFEALWNIRPESITRDKLNKVIWEKTSISSNTLDVHLVNLRKKLNESGYDIETASKGKLLYLREIK